MYGRGSRSQSICKGSLFLKEDSSTDVDPWDILRSYTQAAKHNGGKNLRSLFEVSKALSQFDVVYMKKAYENQNWSINDQFWNLKYPLVVKQLKAASERTNKKNKRKKNFSKVCRKTN